MRHHTFGLPSWLAAFGIASLAIGSVDLGRKIKPILDEVVPAPVALRMQSRVTPARVRWLEGSASVSGAEGLADRDTGRACVLAGRASVVFELEQPEEVASLRLFGNGDCALSVSYGADGGWIPVAGLQGLRTGDLDPGWNKLVPEASFTTASIRLDLEPLGPEAALPEIEIWIRSEVSLLPAAPERLMALAATSTSSALRTFPAPPGEVTIETSPAVVTIDVTGAPTQFRRAYLTYELQGLRSWMAVPRAINERASAVGMLDSPTEEWTPQIERIDAAWLRAGDNRIAFEPSLGSLPYAVRNVRLLAELDTAANAVEQVAVGAQAPVERLLHPAADGDVATAWSAAAPELVTLALDRQVEATELGLLLAAAPSGTLEVRAVADNGSTAVLGAFAAQHLVAGWNVLSLEPGHAAERLQVAFEPGPGGPWQVQELVPIGSGVGARAGAGIALSWPTEGQFQGREAYLRGFAPRVEAEGGVPSIRVGNTAIETGDGAFGVTVSKDALGFVNDEDAVPWSVEVVATYPSGRTIARTVVLDRYLPGPESIEGRLLGSRTFPVLPGQARKIRHDGATLDVEPGSVETEKDVKVTPLRAEDLPALDTGLTNVTRGPRRGYRFEPHGSKFLKALRVGLPYDPAQLPEGMTEQDVRAFYFDDQAGRWQPLPRVTVDVEARAIVSLTDHFTDMIAGTLSIPDHPESFSHDPTFFEKVAPADPAERIVLIEPPKVSGTGDARLRYPFDLPPGRAGMTPDLALDYSSTGRNGWLGVGWSLGVPAVAVDTRWGAPRFDAGLETETYALGGEQLNPGAHRGALEPRTVEKSFHFRKEGAFARIVRHGNDPASYWWEVTDKEGGLSVFGGTLDTVLADGAGRISRWLLREKRDLHGNGMRFAYARVDDSGLPAGTVPGHQLYLRQIEYTTSGAAPGAFTVQFVRDGDLGEPRRPDVQIDARGGFKEVTSQLLRRIDVSFQGTPVRTWELRYVRGAFEKTLLESITQQGRDGSVLSTHRFAYHDDVRVDGAYEGLGPVETWSTGDDGVHSGPVDAIASLFGSDAGQATALSGYETTHAGGHLYAGFNFDSPQKQGSAGAKVGFTGTVDSQGLLAVTDLNGDQLPDKVFRNGSGTFLRLNRSGPRGTTEFGPPIPIPSLPALSQESASIFSAGVEVYRVASVIANHASGITSAPVYLTDVNGDGLTDLVNGGTVLFNRLDADGIPSFDPDSGTSPVPVGPGAVDPGVLPDYGPKIQEILERSPLHDTLRRWEAPFPGQVRITGDVSLLPPPPGSAGTDGVRVTIQHNGTERWAATLEAGTTSTVTPENVDAISVAKGDRIYFRVQSRQEGSHDAVAWDPEIVYQGVPVRIDANGLNPWRFQASEDFVFAGRPKIQVKMPFNGRVRLVGDLHKTGVTTDAITLLVFKNGGQVYADGLDWDEVGDIALGIGFDVAQGDIMELRVRVDSPIDLAKIEWVPSLFYEGPPDAPAPTVTQDGVTRTIERVVDQDGNPIIQLHPAYHIDFYPVNALLAPQSPYVADDDGTITISSHLLATPGTNGVVFMTAKRAGTLAAKRTIFIVNGAVQNRVVDIEVEEDDEIFLDYSCLDPELAPRIFNRVIRVDGDVAPSAFHTTAFQGVFPLGYRGWAVAGYNGNPPRAEQPIVEADLNVVFDENSALDPRTDKAFLFTPFPEGSIWRGPEEETAVSALGARSSRLGPNAVVIPGMGGAPARAPSRLGSSDQNALQLEAAFLSGSKSLGDGGSDLDFLDMNGDRFPDVVGTGRIQYSPAIGGLEPIGRAVATVDTVRRSDSEAQNVGVGGSPANFRVGARGQVDSPGRGGGQKENDTRPQMVSLGLSGSLGSGSSSVPFDLVDLNGDALPDRVTASNGTIEVAFNLGYGFAAPEPWGEGVLNQGSSDSVSVGTTLGFNSGIYDYAGGISLSRNASETSAMLTDINADGLPDRLTRDGDRLLVGLNVGNGFLTDVEWGGAPQGAFATTADATVGGGVYFTLPIGPLCIGACWVILNPGLDGSTSLARQETALLDLDGDGYVDHVASTDEASMTVARNRTGRTNLLRSIERPLGARIELDYARDGNTPDLPQSRWVLSRSSIHDGLLGDGVDVQLATFRYEGGVWDRLEREFYGYGTVVEEVRDVSQAEAVHRTVTRTYAVDSFYTRGLPLGERIADGAGRPFKETENTLEVVDVATQAPLPDRKSTTATAFPATVRTDVRFFEGQPAAGKTTHILQEFDAVGNMVRRLDVGDPGPEDDLEELTEYGSCTATHVVGTPVASVAKGNGIELRRRSAILDCATGELTQITQYLADATGATTNFEHDAFGNLVRLVGPPNRAGQRYELRYAYDPEVQTHVAQVTDSFGYVSTALWDVALARQTRATDAAGQTTTYVYDTHGRLTSMRGPYEQGSAALTLAFEYHPEAAVPWSRTHHLDSFRDASDPIVAIRFVDGLRRIVQEKSDATLFTAAAGSPSHVMVVSGRIRFDAVGRTPERWHPVVEPLGTPGVFNPTYDTVSPTRTVFDVLDRTLSVTSPDGSVTTTTYGFGQDRNGSTQFETRILDARGAISHHFKNVRDLLTGMKQLNRLGAGVQEIWTSYGYDALRRLTRMTDDRSNATRITWDNLDRKVSVDSPDEGRTEQVYDLAGNKTARVTANLRASGQQITYEHAFNRLERILYPGFPANSVTYTYGAPGAPGNGAGRVVRIADPSGIRERVFGKLGEIVSEIRTIPGTTESPIAVYTSQYTYDTFNRLQSMIYPDGELLTLRYDAGGRLRQITGRKGAFDYEYLRRMEYDKFGEHAFVEAGNGTRTTYAHRPDNRYLERVTTARPDGRPFVDLTYAYDAVGNVLSRTNAVPVATGSDFGGPSEQTFVYDDLDRMLGSRGTYEFAPGKLDRYVVALDYDTIHNMRSRTQHHEIVQPSGSPVRQGKTSYAFAYDYAGQQPHGATHIGERSFAYDANGNQLGWQHDVNGTRRTIVWDEENRMQSLFENGQQMRFVYDDQGERSIKRGPQGETVYVSPWLTVRNGTTGTKHVWAGTMRIASKLMKQERPGGNQSGSMPLEKDRYFFHPDHTGTTNFVSDAAGRLYEHLEYFPFGETWVQESSNTQRTPYAFTAKELDEETGLTYLGARYLDPRLGSFNSGEPLLFDKPEKARDDARFLSVYAYGYQNPERFLDPDGNDVIILVGQPAGDQRLAAGYPAAAKQLQTELKAKNITAHIVNMAGQKGKTVDLLTAQAKKIQAAGGKVSSLVYIGHGEVGRGSPGRLAPTEDKVFVSGWEAVKAARVEDNGALVAWGCEVSVANDRGQFQGKKINVYTTRGKWTYTHSGGTGALGHPSRRYLKPPLPEEETKYGNIWNYTLGDVTMGVDLNRGEKNLRENIIYAEEKVNGTP